RSKRCSAPCRSARAGGPLPEVRRGRCPDHRRPSGLGNETALAADWGRQGVTVLEGCSPGTGSCCTYDAVEPMEELTLENVLLALLPRAVMAVMQTTIIRASMTAYSTAVGPSSRLRKSATFCANLRIC